MSACELVARVLTWAADPVGPPPRGLPTGIETLIEPDRGAVSALSALTVSAAAELRLDPKALGAVSQGPLVMAAAIGLREVANLPFLLLESLDGLGEGDWPAAHKLVLSSWRHLSPGLFDTLMRCSPLSGTLLYPLPGRIGRALAVARRLAELPGGTRALRCRLAAPTDNIRVRRWRGELMERWRSGSEEQARTVLDIYEHALVYHGDKHLAQARTAATVLRAASCASDHQLANALAIARWWKPLHGFLRTRPESLRQRPYLPFTFREGTRLFQETTRILGVEL